MTTPDPALLAEVLRHALDGVAVVEGGDTPRVVYANATLAGLLRQPEEWPAGRALGEIEIEAPADPNATTVGIGQRVRLRRGSRKCLSRGGPGGRQPRSSGWSAPPWSRESSPGSRRAS